MAEASEEALVVPRKILRRIWDFRKNVLVNLPVDVPIIALSQAVVKVENQRRLSMVQVDPENLLPRVAAVSTVGDARRIVVGFEPVGDFFEGFPG